VVAAAALVVTAAVVVIGAVLSASATLVSVAAVLAVVLATAALRIMHTELIRSRRTAAADRAAQAQGYREITEARSRENHAFASLMEARLASGGHAITQLESAVVASQGRAAESMRKLSAETRRADVAEAEGTRLAVALEESEERAAEAIVRVAELEDENATLHTENATLRSELDAATSWPQVKHA
jgi:hypothetical protein